jgi:hypothetical protein
MRLCQLIFFSLFGLILQGCGSTGASIDLWPFGASENNASASISRPANSKEYQCDKGRKFYTRFLDKGETVWLILKDREINLLKNQTGEYTNSGIMLKLDKENAELVVANDAPYINCKIVPLK